MKYFTTKKLFSIYLPLLLLLNAAAPKLNAQALFSGMDRCQKSLVYSYVFIPIMEISVLIAHYIIPVPDITTAKDSQKNNESRNKSASTEYLLNLPNRVPIVLRTIKDIELKYYLDTVFSDYDLLKGLLFAPSTDFTLTILPLTSLIFLFKPLMPRSDIPLLLVSAL
ncbi:MAG: hypothetical protein LHV68_00635 [Elusimicrobia bacterium]|nr:hypothetical protein [Candidatus Liberimonas magnetica]